LEFFGIYLEFFGIYLEFFGIYLEFFGIYLEFIGTYGLFQGFLAKSEVVNMYKPTHRICPVNLEPNMSVDHSRCVIDALTVCFQS
jgi:hypothetical protein